MGASHFTEEDRAAAKRRRELEEKIDRDDRLTPATKTVGRELLRWINRDVGYSWISAAKLAAKIKLSPRAVAYALPQLERCGYFVAEPRRGRTTLYKAVYDLPAAPATSAKFAGVTSANFAVHLRKKRPKTSAKFADKTLREISNKNLSEAPPPASGWQARKEAGHAALAKLRAQVEAQQEATDEESKTIEPIELTATVERSPLSALPVTKPKRSEHTTRALADLAARKGRPVPPPPVIQLEPDVRTITADQVAAVITNKPVPPAAIDVTPPPEAPMLTPLASEVVSPQWDTCLQFAAEWGGINLDHAVEVVSAMVAKRPIEDVHYHFGKVAKLHRSGQKKLTLVERAIAKELADLHPAQGDLFAPSPGVLALGATSPPAGAAPPPQALVFDLAALREYASQIAAWQPQFDAATAQRVAREWMATAGVKRLGQLFATVGPRKRSGAFKFGWIKDRVDNPRALPPARRTAQGSSS
jgi:DNA-binding transcriptional ArsR family regulator